MRRTLVLLASLVLLWALVAELNHGLSSLHVYVFVGGLYVGFSALTQPLRPGLSASLIAGLICDATTPVLFGTHALLFSAAHLVVFRVRDRVPREDNIASTLLVLFTNFALFLAFSFTQVHAAPLPGAYWSRLLADLVCSQIFIALVTPWYFALQARALALVEAVAALRAQQAR
jgi:rod shape-determining protein MreD